MADMTRAGRLVGALAIALASLCASAAGADVVRMKDGRVFEGRIKETTTMRVVIDTLVAGIRTTLTLDRTRVAEIERKPLPDGFFGKGASGQSQRPTKPAPRDEPDARGQRTLYVEVPLSGVFGEDILPEGVRDALSLARRQGVEHIVFTLDSPGGYVDAARQIANILAEREGDFTYHALVKKGYSASVWVIFSCDNVFVQPGGAFGAAVAFTQNNSTGAVEVDAKMNSALAGEVAGIAERKGHNPDIARAMIVMDASLFEWRGANGSLRVGAHAPSGAASMQQLDTPATVLTLTAPDAARLGAVRAVVEDAAGIGTALGFNNWIGDDRIGAAAMARAKSDAQREAQKFERDVDRTRKDIVATLSGLHALRQRAATENPERFTYYYDAQTGLLTPESQQKWKAQVDKETRVWNDVMAGLRRLKRLLDHAKQLGLELEPQVLTYAMPVEKEAQARLQWLQANRNKTYR